jgi:hypothetical protein
VFTNTSSGTLEKSAGTGESEISLPFDNAGLVDTAAGSFVFAFGIQQVGGLSGSFNVSTGSTLVLGSPPVSIPSGAVISGGGTLEVNGQVTLAPGSSVHTGGLIIDSGATLQVNLAGHTAGSSYPQLVVNGTAQLSGNLIAATVSQYCAAQGATFAVLRYLNRSGTFTSAAGSPGEQSFSLTYGASGATLKATSTACDTAAPTISSTQLDTAGSPTDALLQRQLNISAADNSGGSGTAEIDWGWASGAGATTPTGPIHSVAETSGTDSFPISYADTNPNSQWTLSVGSNNSTTIATPAAITVLALGDSITSGHHRLPTDKHTVCEDASFSYAADYAAEIKSKIPNRWWGAYDNFAVSGFTTQEVITGLDAKGNVAEDACKQVPPNTAGQAPLTIAQSTLSADAGSWNRVVITAGIDDTNWTSSSPLTGPIFHVVLNYVVDAAAGLPYTGTQCSIDMATWNGPKLKNKLIQNVATIYDGLIASDPTVRINWLGYYDPSGTGLMPSVCQSTASTDISNLDQWIQTGLGTNANLVDITGVMDDQPGYIQPLKYSTITFNGPPGWPHPNVAGEAAIAATVPPG